MAAEFGGFKIGVAAFPDGHPSSDGDIDKDIDVLLEKQRRGATFATTQFFFEVDKWKRLVDSLAARGSSMPIIAGVLPVTNVKLLTKMAELGGTPIPASIAARFAAVEDNPEDVRKLGVEIALNLCNDLIDAGVPGIHFYTMNSSTATSEIFESLQDRR
jgi:methylenetetrahydrofolate reductase (NADPH)